MIEPEEPRGEGWPVAAEEPSRARSTSHWLILLGLIGATAVLLLLAAAVEPDPRGYGTHERLGLAPCQLMEWTGLPCPGCGITTSATLAARGHVWQSILVQPFGLLTALGLPLLACWAIFVHFRGGDLYQQIARRRVRWIRWTLLLMGLAWGYKIVAVTL